jgi:hypothetical protein
VLPEVWGFMVLVVFEVDADADTDADMFFSWVNLVDL